jgi:hypothetical protein
MESKAVNLQKELQQQQEEVDALSALWIAVVDPNTRPKGPQFHVWIERYGFDAVDHGIRALAKKLLVLESMNAISQYKFATKCMQCHAGVQHAQESD